MSFRDNEGWFWYWWDKELEEDPKEEEDDKSAESERSTYKWIEVTEENEDAICVRCGEPLGEQGEIAIVEIMTGSLHVITERKYLCEKCASKILRKDYCFLILKEIKRRFYAPYRACMPAISPDSRVRLFICPWLAYPYMV